MVRAEISHFPGYWNGLGHEEQTRVGKAAPAPRQNWVRAVMERAKHQGVGGRCSGHGSHREEKPPRAPGSAGSWQGSTRRDADPTRSRVLGCVNSSGDYREMDLHGKEKGLPPRKVLL